MLVAFFWPTVFCLRFGYVSWDDTLTYGALFSPLSNMHSFFSGVLLAKLFMARANVLDAPQDYLTLRMGSRTCAFSATAALGALIFLFLYVDNTAFSPLSLATRTGVLLPLQMLLIWGLAAEEDPLARLCQMRPFVWGGTVAYGIFILQHFFIHWNLVNLANRIYGQGFTDRFSPALQCVLFALPSLIALTVVVEGFLVDPLRKCLD